MGRAIGAASFLEVFNGGLPKPEFFGADMYMFHVAGFRPRRGVITAPAKPPQGARLDVWNTDPADRRRVPAPGGEGVLFSTTAFAPNNSGNRTLRAPKPSWSIILDAAENGNRLAGMTRINLKAMYNDPSQMREALAWRLFGMAGIPAPRHVTRALGRLGKHVHFHLHDGHPLVPGLRDHFSFLTRLPIPFSYRGRRSLPMMYGPAGLASLVSTAIDACPPQDVSFTIEVHQVEGRLPLADSAWLFPHWRDTTNAER